MMLLSQEDGIQGLKLARDVVWAVVMNEKIVLSPLPPVFSEDRGVFVTLKRNGELRGCIGLPLPVMPLKDAIIEAATSASRDDPRFPPVGPGEIPSLHIEVTILSPPEEITGSPIERQNAVIVGRHGLIIRGRGRSGLLLPQVASEYRWDSVEFLDQTCRKAGLPPGCWRDETISVLRFEGQIFSE